MVKKGRGQLKVRVSKVEDSEVVRAGMSRTVREFITFERHFLYVLYRKEQGLIPEGHSSIGNVNETKGRKGRCPTGDARVAA